MVMTVNSLGGLTPSNYPPLGLVLSLCRVFKQGKKNLFGVIQWLMTWQAKQ